METPEDVRARLNVDARRCIYRAIDTLQALADSIRLHERNNTTAWRDRARKARAELKGMEVIAARLDHMHTGGQT